MPVLRRLLSLPLPVLRAVALGLWGFVLLQSGVSGRLDLLLRAVFHPLVWISGGVLLLLAALELRAARSHPPQRGGPRRGALLLGCACAVLVLALPPRPSFSELAANREANLLEEPPLAFVVPPAQRSLTDWVRLLRSEPDPSLHAGDPVRISGFVLPVKGDRPRLARLIVRCCLVDATPVGLPVLWPAGKEPGADRWLAVEGVMGTETRDGRIRSVVIARSVRPIPRPRRPLEP